MNNSPISAANWSFPTRVWFGSGRATEIVAALAEIGARNPLLVTDQGLASHPMITEMQATLTAAAIDHSTFTQIKPNPTGANVEAGTACLRNGKHDSVIAVGGGSALDAAKAIAMMAGQDKSIWEFEDIGDNWRGANAAAMLPVIALPTTSGTGSELGRSSVITQEDPHRKVIIFHPDMLPKLVIMDPSLTISLPATLTAATGMDALSHALEAYCAPGYHPMADGLALQAMSMIRESLVTAVENGGDIEARSAMLAASGMACIALQKGLGAMHAISHPLGAVYDVHHGMLNAVLMPYVLDFNLPVIEQKLARLAKTLLLGDDAKDFIDWTKALRTQLGVPNTLSELGVRVNEPDLIAHAAAKDPCAQGNPVFLDARAALLILKSAS
jgi:alcohol dehydrogenase class IV